MLVVCAWTSVYLNFWIRCGKSFIQQVISKSKEHDIDVTEFSLVEGIQSLFIILGMAYILMHLRRILRQNRPRNFQLET